MPPRFPPCLPPPCLQTYLSLSIYTAVEVTKFCKNIVLKYWFQLHLGNLGADHKTSSLLTMYLVVHTTVCYRVNHGLQAVHHSPVIGPSSINNSNTLGIGICPHKLLVILCFSCFPFFCLSRFQQPMNHGIYSSAPSLCFYVCF